MAARLYLDTSAVLRATLEAGTTPELEHLATFVLTRRRLEGLELVGTDDRLLDAAGVV